MRFRLKKPKCAGCKQKIDTKGTEIELRFDDGIKKVKVCDSCLCVLAPVIQHEEN